MTQEDSVLDVMLKASNSDIERKATVASKFIDRFGVATGVLAVVSIGWLINFTFIVKPDKDQDRQDRKAAIENQHAVSEALTALSRQPDKFEKGFSDVSAKLSAIDSTLKGQSKKLDEQGETLQEIAHGQRAVLEMIRSEPVFRTKPME